MTDTQKSISDLINNVFQDGQAANSVSVSDVRDLIMSLVPQSASGHFEGNATETVVASVGVYVPIMGALATVMEDDDITVANGKMTYTGVRPRNFLLSSNLSMTAASNGKIIAFKFAKNGTTFGTIVERYISNGADIGAAGLNGNVVMSNGDYVEVFGTNLTDSTNFTVKDFYSFASGHTV